MTGWDQQPGHHPGHQRTIGPCEDRAASVMIDYGHPPDTMLTRSGYSDHRMELENGDRSRQGTILRTQSHGKILETHFDDPPSYHTRSSSYSVAGSYQDPRPGSYHDPRHNLNNSFPGCETPYISSSVTLPANPDPVGFYHNVSGRMRQPSLRHRRQEEEARHSFARQADLHKSPRTQELEEFAAKFEGYQKQRTRRMASAAMAQPTPMLDQLARETNNQFWLAANPDQLSTLESSLLRLVQRNDSISSRVARGLYNDTELSSSGRESVATVISNSSSDTIKFNERHSSSETLKYYEPGDDTPSEAVRQSHRTGSICDEHFLGHDSNHNTWMSGHNAKRQLYRSHSEAGAREDSNGHVDSTWQRCSYCGAQQPEHHDACPILADFRQSQDPVSDNMVLPDLNTITRRSTRARKPKLPTPPCSPLTSAKAGGGCSPPGPPARLCTPSPPPPPQPGHDQMIAVNEPLPPPPSESMQDKNQEAKTNGGIQTGEQEAGHYRMPVMSSSTPPPRNIKTPAATPKRESPATIAAKEAPGWEKFLGVKSQTVSFTSEEATKFRAARDESRNRSGAPRKDERTRAGGQRNEVLNNFFHKMEETNKNDNTKPIHQSRSDRTPRRRREEFRMDNQKQNGLHNGNTDENHNIQNGFLPSPSDKQQSLHLSRERSLKSISNWWKNSLEGGPPPPGWQQDGSGGDSPSPRHNHSHSDSGISSMSGRSSCMSPMSELSSSSGSSRTSLRSSSIVSASNILLEEEGESEMEYADLCKELLLFAPPDSRIVGFIRTSLTPLLQVYFPENSLEFEIITTKENNDFEPTKRSRSTNFEESRKNLLKHACMRIDTQRKHQQLLKESTKSNEETGKEILGELKEVCQQQQETDKVKLFTEEVDKITSLIIGLSSRLAKVNAASTAKNAAAQDEKSQRFEAERRDKLEEQLDEARKLRQSIFRRGDAAFGILGKYLDTRSVDAFGGFIKEKIRLILENRQHSELLKVEEEILKSLKEYNSVTGVMII